MSSQSYSKSALSKLCKILELIFIGVLLVIPHGSYHHFHQEQISIADS